LNSFYVQCLDEGTFRFGVRILKKLPPPALEPRKSPIQARSQASVDAILKATIQVLLSVGKDRLTTTRVAHRAGVSVGTLYQYFPNKNALLRAAVQQHMDQVGSALESACREQAGQPLQQMATAVITSFLAAKMKDPQTSAALYTIASGVDGAKIVREMSRKANRAIVTMLKSSSEKLQSDPELVSSMLQASMAGVSRRLLDSPSPHLDYETIRDELVFLACAYLRARSRR
jgi:AcrR family transcriptional regulator